MHQVVPAQGGDEAVGVGPGPDAAWPARAGRRGLSGCRLAPSRQSYLELTAPRSACTRAMPPRPLVSRQRPSRAWRAYSGIGASSRIRPGEGLRASLKRSSTISASTGPARLQRRRRQRGGEAVAPPGWSAGAAGAGRAWPARPRTAPRRGSAASARAAGAAPGPGRAGPSAPPAGSPAWPRAARASRSARAARGPAPTAPTRKAAGSTAARAPSASQSAGPRSSWGRTVARAW